MRFLFLILLLFLWCRICCARRTVGAIQCRHSQHKQSQKPSTNCTGRSDVTVIIVVMVLMRGRRRRRRRRRASRRRRHCRIRRNARRRHCARQRDRSRRRVLNRVVVVVLLPPTVSAQRIQNIPSKIQYSYRKKEISNYIRHGMIVVDARLRRRQSVVIEQRSLPKTENRQLRRHTLSLLTLSTSGCSVGFHFVLDADNQPSKLLRKKKNDDDEQRQRYKI